MTMASKKLLYKPALQEANPPKQQRKTLAQGRLVMKQSTPDCLPVAAISKAVVSSTAVHQPAGLPTQLGLSSSFTTLSDSQCIENNVTPRKKLTNVSTEDSPREAKPTHSLDLSDSDAEDQPAGNGDRPEVMVVDASRQLKSLDDTEVDLTVHLGQSPAKIICHAPNKMQTSILGSSAVGAPIDASKVSVDRIPSVLINEKASGGQKQTTWPAAKLPVVVRESGLSAAAEPHFKALMAIAERKSSVSESETVSNVSAQDDLSNPVAVSLLPADRNEKAVVISQGASKSKCVTLALDDEISLKVQAKKKAGKVVPSRYMQAGKGPVRGDRKVLSDAYSKLNTTAAAPLSHDTSVMHGGHRRHQGTSSLRRSVSDTKMKFASLSVTPDPRANFGGQSSTPNTTSASGDGTSFLAPAAADISAIDVTSGDRTMSFKPKSFSQLRRDLQSGASLMSSSNTSTRDCILKGLKPKGSAEVTQWDLELLYGRVIQWAFLESKARKCLKEQEKLAMNQLHELFELTERQRRRKAELELQLAKFRHTNALDEAIELQQSGLNGPVSRLSRLSDQYHQLAGALDTTRHHIPTKGLYFPRDNKDEYLDELSRALQESEHLLGELSAMTRKETPAIDQCAKLLNATESVVARQVSELSRSQSLLCAINSLLVSENALRVQQLYGASVTDT